jgi:hypothetical protein
MARLTDHQKAAIQSPAYPQAFRRSYPHKV